MGPVDVGEWRRLAGLWPLAVGGVVVVRTWGEGGARTPLAEALPGAAGGACAVALALGGLLLTGRPRAAERAAGAALLGLAAALEPPLLLLLLPLLAAGARRPVLGAAGVWAAAVAPGLADAGEWFRTAAPGAAEDQSLHGALLRLGLTGTPARAGFLALAAVVCALAVRRAVRYLTDGQPVLAAAVTGCAALALAPGAPPQLQLWIALTTVGRAGRRRADRYVWPAFALLAVGVDGDVLLPRLAVMAPLGENVPLLAALLAACAVPFLPRAQAGPPEGAPGAGRPNLVLELLLIRVGYWAYSWVRGHADGDRATAEEHGRQVLGLQRVLGLDVERGLNEAVAARRWLADAMDLYYATFHFAVPLTILGWLLLRHPGAYRAARSGLAFTTLFGLAGFWLYPLAPPRLMPGLGYIDTANGVQDLDSPRYGALTGISNPYAAMPSLHVGWSLWCALTLWRLAPWRWLRLAGFAYPLATTLVVMGTANHYLLDAVGGAAAVALGLAASSAVGRALRLRPHAEALRPAPTPPPPAPASRRRPERPDEREPERV
ncbi:phosphatase PAP2 family protein [Streptomyces sp. DSM 44917]|uniref:Phosphatase PAP2 family protein n=1 Tax=Streptomyces boetiae TaxID=3075541 RepID=A0ABU2L2W0_9ACTN|nr:phosphatase PAP2 family protein [Streptomyces sp. DSM 44917]MDT0305573.1 phosphatase PAP2 family protein [Streptomyces sp. DSM 44917]